MAPITNLSASVRQRTVVSLIETNPHTNPRDRRFVGLPEDKKEIPEDKEIRGKEPRDEETKDQYTE